MSNEPDLRLQMCSDPMYLAGARTMVSAVAQRLGFDDPSCGKIALAIDEALCNVMKHGYERRTDGRIWLNVWPSAPDGSSGVTITIEDEARKVDPSTIKSRPLEEIRPGGLGVHIIREVMDEVKYEQREHAGMRLTMVKRLPLAGGEGDGE